MSESDTETVDSENGSTTEVESLLEQSSAEDVESPSSPSSSSPGRRKRSSSSSSRSSSSLSNLTERVAVRSWAFFVLFVIGCVAVVFHGSLGAGYMRNQPKNPSGPWNECLWMKGSECAKYIQSQVPSYIDIEFQNQDEYAVSTEGGFHPNRVIIWVDEHDQVVEIPVRGRRRRRTRVRRRERRRRLQQSSHDDKSQQPRWTNKETILPLHLMP
mmetsp:Transcript_17959/g.48816  ORF Transcript_17959/g.48816 Transcript_17959/m.48816 type:complete len:214 (+) Transcript_17959:78-719(+)